MSSKTPDLRHLLHGVLPPIAMPFDEQGRLTAIGRATYSAQVG